MGDNAGGGVGIITDLSNRLNVQVHEGWDICRTSWRGWTGRTSGRAASELDGWRGRDSHTRIRRGKWRPHTPSIWSDPRTKGTKRRPAKFVVGFGVDTGNGCSDGLDEEVAMTESNVESVIPHMLLADQGVRKAGAE